MAITVENMKNEMIEGGDLNFKDEWFVEIERMNKELVSKGMCPLIDLKFLKQIAAIKTNPNFKTNTLPPVPEGKECIIDITGRNPPKIVDAVPCDEDGFPIETPRPIPPADDDVKEEWRGLVI